MEFKGVCLAVIGHPIAHSISPEMHNAALDVLKAVDTRFNDWSYYRFDIHPDQLAEALPLFHKQKFHGLNLTIPHKVQALGLIKEIEPRAKLMGAVNTLVWHKAGYLGMNTDGHGLEQGLWRDLKIKFTGSAVIIIGAGGAARSAAVQAILSGCTQLYLGNRSPARLEALIHNLKPIAKKTQLQAISIDSLPLDLPNSGILVNATALGLKPEDPAPIDIEQIPSGWKVYDMIYNPPETAMLKQAKAHGLEVANGLSMLVAQGARSLEAWTNKTIDKATMLNAARNALKQQL